MATKKTLKVPASEGKKKKRGSQTPFNPAFHEAVKTVRARKKATGHFLASAVPAVPCLPAETATGIVFACLGKPVALNQTLGQLFPNDNARAAFCRCVSTSAHNHGVDKPSVPCKKDTTVGEVIQGIAC